MEKLIKKFTELIGSELNEEVILKIFFFFK